MVGAGGGSLSGRPVDGGILAIRGCPMEGNVARATCRPCVNLCDPPGVTWRRWGESPLSMGGGGGWHSALDGPTARAVAGAGCGSRDWRVTCMRRRRRWQTLRSFRPAAVVRFLDPGPGCPSALSPLLFSGSSFRRAGNARRFFCDKTRRNVRLAARWQLRGLKPVRTVPADIRSRVRSCPLWWGC